MFDPDTRFRSDFAVDRDSVDENYIPTTQRYKPNETKKFTFYWYPAEREKGIGSLSIFLPHQYKPITPFRININ